MKGVSSFWGFQTFIAVTRHPGSPGVGLISKALLKRITLLYREVGFVGNFPDDISTASDPGSVGFVATAALDDADDDVRVGLAVGAPGNENPHVSATHRGAPGLVVNSSTGGNSFCVGVETVSSGQGHEAFHFSR